MAFRETEQALIEPGKERIEHEPPLYKGTDMHAKRAVLLRPAPYGGLAGGGNHAMFMKHFEGNCFATEAPYNCQ